MATFPHLDSAQSVFFARQLEEIDAQNYDVKYAELEALQLVSAKKLSAGAETYTYRQFDGRAVAKMTSNYASGSPRADVSGKEFTSKVRSIRNSYGYNVQEIRAAQETNPPTPLDAMKAATARRGIAETINRIALLGEAEHNIVGLFGQPNAQTYTIAGGTWLVKSADAILDDMFGMVDQIPTVTKEIEKPNRLLIPWARLRLIGRKRIGTDTTTTVLQFFQQQRPQIEVRGAMFLDTAGTGATARAMVYNSARENLELLLPIAFESFPPQLSGMEYTIENHARMGGVVVRYPLTVLYADGI